MTHRCYASLSKRSKISIEEHEFYINKPSQQRCKNVGVVQTVFRGRNVWLCTKHVNQAKKSYIEFCKETFTN